MTSYKEPLKIIKQTPPAASQEAADPDKEDAQ